MVRDGYDAVLYDLDGTLVRLAVDWERVREDVAALFRSLGHDPGERSLWDLLERADAVGGDLPTRVNDAVARHEREGARRSRLLPTAEELPAVAADRPVGVVSLNAESACRVALETHSIDDRVSTVVGRDTVAERKPHPEPLLTALRSLEVAPERALFVGDSGRDRRAADRAGVDFLGVGAAATDE